MEETKTGGLLIEKQYKIPFEMFREAFITFQKRYVYPRTYTVMALLLAVCGIYAYFIAYGGENANRTLYVMIIMFCLAMMIIQWVTPRRTRRTLMEGIREIGDDEYRLSIYPEYLEIGTMLPPENAEAAEMDDLFDDAPEEDFSGTRIYYNKGMHVDEHPAFFLVYQQKAMIYVVPKSAFSEEELEIMRVHFSKRLEKNFKGISKNPGFKEQ